MVRHTVVVASAITVCFLAWLIRDSFQAGNVAEHSHSLDKALSKNSRRSRQADTAPPTLRQNVTTPSAPPAFQSPAEETAFLLDRARASGASADSWTAQARTDINDAVKLLADPVQVAQAECYVDACFVQLTYSSMSTFNRVSKAIDESPPLLKWARAFTGPDVHQDGHVENALLLFPAQ